MMETVVLVPAQLQVCPGPGLVAATSLAPGLSLGPHTGHLQQLILPPFPLLGSLDPKHRFGLHDEIKQVGSLVDWAGSGQCGGGGQWQKGSRNSRRGRAVARS